MRRLARLASGPDRVPGRRAARTRLDLARRRAGATTIHAGRRPVRRRPAPRRRHCRRNGDADPCSGRRSRELRRHGPRRWARGHGADGHGLLGDARAPGLDRGRAGPGPVRGSDGRRDRPDRRRRAPRALRPSRDTADVGPARLPRSAVVPPTAGRAAPAGAATPARRPGACGAAGFGAAVTAASARVATPGAGDTGPWLARIRRWGACERARACSARGCGRAGGCRPGADGRSRPAGDGASGSVSSAPSRAPELVRARVSRSRPGKSSLRAWPGAAGRERPRPVARRGRAGCGDRGRCRRNSGRSGVVTSPPPPARRHTARTRSAPCDRPAIASRRRRCTRWAVGSRGWSDPSPRSRGRRARGARIASGSRLG